jgi:hypothetical protein
MTGNANFTAGPPFKRASFSPDAAGDLSLGGNRINLRHSALSGYFGKD